MTPKEKAEQLVDKFFRQQPMCITLPKQSAKQCAIITQQEKIGLLKKHSRSIGISIELEHQTAILTELEKL